MTNSAVQRVSEYLHELSTRSNLDQEVIQNLRPEALGEISLRVDDIKELLNIALESKESLKVDDHRHYVQTKYKGKGKIMVRDFESDEDYNIFLSILAPEEIILIHEVQPVGSWTRV